MFGGRTRTSTASRCRRGQHHLCTKQLILRHPTADDATIAVTGASDDAAQRWLGWLPRDIVREQHRAAYLAQRPGQGSRRWSNSPGQWLLVAIHHASDRIAGGVVLDKVRHEVGGWLAPAFRARGLGRELFEGAAIFAHHHLGVATVRAGTEVANTACVGALTSAGFIEDTGPDHHQLPNGRTVSARWFRHDAEYPTTCR
ncbi:GNAT family N-acetyltransferase [Actinocrispum wychmicini]|uniref:GNAT family N-acetyltransferase n=1 Tax=Actinocrispum wychmicini TaxID=1213861 RepID=UPI003C7C4BDF